MSQLREAQTSITIIIANPESDANQVWKFWIIGFKSSATHVYSHKNLFPWLKSMWTRCRAVLFQVITHGCLEFMGQKSRVGVASFPGQLALVGLGMRLGWAGAYIEKPPNVH